MKIGILGAGHLATSIKEAKMQIKKQKCFFNYYKHNNFIGSKNFTRTAIAIDDIKLKNYL